ncbi:uncharacterized membrane protein (UPF0136 family) [Rhodoligotrophos appendicifer]|uniref:hypothetical protein n=1 Tax=Rhodoligotrophos appendicifer TaxID=987056 RepID=UPI001186BD9A|nr:hypothetical protein [Rhodoligotrophos appendicifer]
MKTREEWLATWQKATAELMLDGEKGGADLATMTTTLLAAALAARKAHRGSRFLALELWVMVEEMLTEAVQDDADVMAAIVAEGEREVRH